MDAMKQGKYIVGELNDKHDTLTAICFPVFVNHDSFKKPFKKILGAGFFRVSESDGYDGVIITAFGYSTTLHVRSRLKLDAGLIKIALGLE